MKRYIDKYGAYAQLLFKALFMIHLLLSINILLVGTPVSRLVLAVSVLVGAVLLFTRLFELKQIIHSFEGVILILFMISYLISVAVNVQYGYISGAKYFIWFALLIGGVFWIKRDTDRKKIYNEFIILSIILIVIVAVTNIVNIALLIDKYSSIYASADGNYYVMGYASWGRLYGIYTDPNYGSVISCAAVVCAIFCFLSARRILFRILLVLSVIVNFLYCSFSASRTGNIAMMIGISVFFFIFLIRKFKKMFVLKSAAAAICAAVISVLVFNGIQTGYNSIQKHIAQSESHNHTANDNEDEEAQDVPIIGRTEEELQGDVSNRRFDIWKSGLEIFRKNPVLGIGWNNTVAYVTENIPDSYMLGDINGLANFDVFHNSFIDVFVFQGLTGGLIMLAFIAYVIIVLVKQVYTRKYEPKYFGIAVSMILLCVFSGCVLSVLVYFNNIISYLFWLFLGYIIYFYKVKDEV